MTPIAYPASPKNYSARPRGAVIGCVVYHDTGGSAESALQWFQNPVAGVSAHYVVARDGRVYACVAEDQKAWHAGSSLLFGIPDLNAWSIGIELEDRLDVGDGYPEAQIEALLHLAVAISKRYRIPLNHHVGHEHIAVPRGRKVDPGADFPWYAYLNALGRRLSLEAPTVTV
jgi:N-acetylmuramoyl-L-alanine amidase